MVYQSNYAGESKARTTCLTLSVVVPLSYSDVYASSRLFVPQPTINTSPVSSPSQFSRRGEHSPIHAPLEVGDGKSSPSAYPLHRSPSPPMTRTPDEGLARPSPDLQDLPVNVAGTLPRRTPSPPAIHEQRPLDAELAPDENKPPVSGEQLQSSSSWTAPIRPFPPSLTSAAAPAAPSSWPKSDPVHLASGSGLTEKPDLDLCSLDPAARGFFLAQQQKLSNLESQLRLLRAEMMREPPAAALAVAVRAAERGPAQQQQAVGKAVAVECEATAMVAGRSMTMIGATVEASTNTSFVWGPPPRQSADDANHHSATVSTPAIDASVVPGASDHDRHNDERSSGTRSSGSGRPSTMRRKEVAVVTPEQQPPLRTVAANNPPRRQQQERVPSSSSARNSLPPPPQPGSRRRANSDISPDRQPATQGYSRGSSREKASNTASLAVSGWTTQRGRAATSVVNAKDGFTSSRSFSPPGGEQNQTPPVLLFNGGRSTSPEKKHDNRDHHDDNDAGRVVGGVGAGSGGGNVSSSEDGSFATMPSPVLLRVPVLGDDASALGGAGHGASEWVRVNAFQELAAAAAAPSSNARPSLPLGPAATVVEVTDSDDFTNAWPGTTQEGDEGKEPAVSSLASPAPSAVVEGGRGRQALPLIDRSNRETSAVQSADDSDEASSTAYQRPTQRRRRQRRRQGSRTRSRDDVGRELECHEGYSGILQVGLSVDSYPGGQGRLSGYYRRSLPMVAKAGGHQSVSVSAAAVLPGAMAGLLVVPRIEFGQLTDDELGSDLDEGEVRIFFSFLFKC